MKLSILGKDFKGKLLSEENLDAGTKVLWKGKEYQTGNRHHHLVELYNRGVFQRVVRMRKIQLIQRREIKNRKG